MTMAKMISGPAFLPSDCTHGKHKLSQGQPAPEPYLKGQGSSVPPLTPNPSLPQKPTESTTLIRAAVCGSAAKNA